MFVVPLAERPVRLERTRLCVPLHLPVFVFSDFPPFRTARVVCDACVSRCGHSIHDGYVPSARRPQYADMNPGYRVMTHVYLLDLPDESVCVHVQPQPLIVEM